MSSRRKKMTGVKNKDIYEILYEEFASLQNKACNLGISTNAVRQVLLPGDPDPALARSGHSVAGKPSMKSGGNNKKWLYAALAVAVVAVICADILLDEDGGIVWKTFRQRFLQSKCLIAQHFVALEVTRPLADCNVCRDVRAPIVLDGNTTTRESFAPHAYAGRPVLVKGAASLWPATRVFSFDFFRRLYQETEGALDSVENECQFFPFRYDLNTLREVFEMPADEAQGLVADRTWYIGWSNCNPKVAKVLRQHYDRPHFLPADSEASTIDWIFMGWSGPGAAIHLDYVQRPSWQAQIAGRKRWKLFPVPECEDVCGGLELTVERGDIVLIDTNQWYHDTYIEPGEISITIGSEYD